MNVSDTQVENINYKDYPILLAEDNTDDILMVKRAWKKGLLKNNLHIVNDGEEAIDFLYRRGKYSDAPKPSLILLDLKMPKIDGFKVLEIIKNDEELKQIPVIVLTGSNRDKDLERAYELGCNSYIVKPVTLDNFIQAVVDIQRYWILLCKIPDKY